MSRLYDEDDDIKIVEQLFDTSGIEFVPFTKDEMRSGVKTPDRKIMRGGKLAGYLEVKSPRDERLNDALASAGPFEIVGHAGHDSIFNRLARHIEKAAAQFAAVNPRREVPNVLVFVNHDDASHGGDLHETLTGHAVTDRGVLPTMLNVSEGKIRELKGRVDVYLWIDARAGRKPRLTQFIGNSDNRAFADSIRAMISSLTALPMD